MPNKNGICAKCGTGCYESYTDTVLVKNMSIRHATSTYIVDIYNNKQLATTEYVRQHLTDFWTDMQSHRKIEEW